MKKLNVLDWVAVVLTIVGGVNWGLIAISGDWNLVNLILGGVPVLERIVYALVGLSALYTILVVKKALKGPVATM
ncbi:MAG: DUF378 domain-containing protein [Candidatus Paceibacterota bacterium]